MRLHTHTLTYTGSLDWTTGLNFEPKPNMLIQPIRWSFSCFRSLFTLVRHLSVHRGQRSHALFISDIHIAIEYFWCFNKGCSLVVFKVSALLIFWVLNTHHSCPYTYTCPYTHPHMYIHSLTHSHMVVHSHTHAHMHAHTHTHCTHTCTHIPHAHTLTPYAHTRTHTCTHMHTARAHTHTHTHTQTHTHSSSFTRIF